MRKIITAVGLVGLLTLAASLSACSSAPKLPTSFSACNPCISRPAALAYIVTHPVPARPGMVAGIVTSWTDLASASYNAWKATVVTSAGALTVRCGRPTAADACTWRGPAGFGDYIYVPASGQLPANWHPGAVVFIKRGAVQP